MSEELITPKKQHVGCVRATLRRWAYQSKIRYVRLPSGKLRYYKSDIEGILRGGRRGNAD